jgi:putative spermidine/putrescine transport system permease protein
MTGHEAIAVRPVKAGRWADRTYQFKQRKLAFLPGLVPALLLYFFLLVAPMLLLGRYSFYRINPGEITIQDPWTTENFARFFSDPYYMEIFAHTLIIGIVVVLLCVILGYPVAYIMARTRRGRGILLMMVLAPFFVSQVVKTIGWMAILSNNGFLNWLLTGVGVTSEPIQILYTRTGIIIGMVHVLIPFMILPIESVIRQINEEVLDAARNLGAREFKVFTRVVVPLSLPGLVAGSLIVFSLAISIFTTPALMGGDRLSLLSNFIYKRAISLLDWPLASVGAWVLLVTGLIIVAAFITLFGRRLKGM